MIAFHKGDRVQYNNHGRTTFARRNGNQGAFRPGAVAAEPRNPKIISVRWDGSKSASTYSAEFFEKAPELALLGSDRP